MTEINVRVEIALNMFGSSGWKPRKSIGFHGGIYEILPTFNKLADTAFTCGFSPTTGQLRIGRHYTLNMNIRKAKCCGKSCRYTIGKLQSSEANNSPLINFSLSQLNFIPEFKKKKTVYLFNQLYFIWLDRLHNNSFTQ